MNVVIFGAVLSLFFANTFASITLPCDFSFDRKFGYTCRIGDISIKSNHEKVSKIVGDHAHDRNRFNRTDRDVLRVIMYDRHIDYLPVNITFYFPYLKTLQVKKCGLKALTRHADFRTLRRMYLGFNEIKKIPERYFWHFCRLETLSLHGNQISSIPRMAFRDLISLKRLSLNGNRLKSIGSVLFTSCLNLEYIDLDNNALRYIENGLFANQSRLHKLLMRNNQIEVIESEFLSAIESRMSFRGYFTGNNCINIDFSLPRDGSYSILRNIFMSDCPEPTNKTTTAPPRTTKKPLKKPKYETPKMIFYENCTWNIHPDYIHHFRHSF